MATVQYYLRSKTPNSKIQVRFSVSRDMKYRTSTDLIINYNDWSIDKNFPKQNSESNKKISKTLRELENYIINEYTLEFANGLIFQNDWLKVKVLTFFNRIDEKEDDSIYINYLENFIEFKQSISAYTECSLRKFKNLKDRFTAFQKLKKRSYLIKDIDEKTIIEFKNYLINDCNLLETTSARFIKNLKTTIFDARKNGKEINHQVPGMKTGTTNTEHKVFLSFNEIEAIKEIQTVNKDYNVARDWLVLGCFLGQRASDLLRMTSKMIYTKTDSEGNSYRFIEIKQQKTNEIVLIPLHDEVEKILKKYEGEFPPRFTDREDTNLTMFNKYIKKVCEIAGLHETIKGKVYNDKLKKNEIVATEKFNLVSSHICRRSFATNFYGNKLFTTPELMRITGHKHESMFLNYIGKTADDWAMQTAKTFRMLSENKKVI